MQSITVQRRFREVLFSIVSRVATNHELALAATQMRPQDLSRFEMSLLFAEEPCGINREGLLRRNPCGEQTKQSHRQNCTNQHQWILWCCFINNLRPGRDRR